MREADIPGRDLPPPGETFPGWELIAPDAPARATLRSSRLLERPVVVWDEPEQVRAAAERLWTRLEQIERSPAYDPDRVFFRWEELERQAEPVPPVSFQQLDIGWSPTGEPAFTSPRARRMAFHGNMQVAVAEARTLVEAGQQGRVLRFFHRRSRTPRRHPQRVRASPTSSAWSSSNPRPPIWPSAPTCPGASPAFTWSRAPSATARSFQDSKLVSLRLRRPVRDLRTGLPRALLQVARWRPSPPTSSTSSPAITWSTPSTASASISDCARSRRAKPKATTCCWSTAGGAKLYVPLTRMDLVQRFRGAGEAKPALDRMGGATWTRTKSRIKAKMRDMADELLKLYAAAQNGRRLRLLPGQQLAARIRGRLRIHRDQATSSPPSRKSSATWRAPQPMDRLLCGDVGFGKTEVVMRAAFKALGDGKQVAVLAPTTVLAFQHFETFKRRFQPFPGPRGDVQPVPHRQGNEGGSWPISPRARSMSRSAPTGCFPQDVEFKDLGLVIVDEEQRFGVKHKERLKQLKKSGGRDQHERHPDPPNTTHVVTGAARHVGDRDAAQGPARDPHRGGALPARTHPLRRWNWN